MPCTSHPVQPHRRAFPLLIALAIAFGVFAAPAGAASGYLFWSNEEGNSIGRADRDGTNVDQAFATTSGSPRHVAVSGDQVYWNAGGAIGRANLDGTGATQSFVAGLGGSGQALAADNAFVYWSRVATNEIGRVALSGVSPVYGFLSARHAVTAIAIDATHLYYTHDGSRIGRIGIDGSAPDEPNFITGATGARGLAVDDLHVYWTENGSDRIGRANLDGSSPDHAFIATGEEPTGIAVDAAHVYWTNEDAGSIGRANLDGTGVEQAFIAGAKDPWGLAVVRGTADTPVLRATTPPSPANENTPKITGTAQDGATVTIYDDDACTHAIATGSAADLAAAGIGAPVPDDSTTTFHATATDAFLDTSACSAGLTYVEDSTPPQPPADVQEQAKAPVDTRARVTGLAEAGTVVRLYTDAACSGDPVASGDAATFASPGIAVPDGVAPPFYATATDSAGNSSPCAQAQALPPVGLPDPEVGRSANIVPVAGTSRVACPGTANDTLTKPRHIPINCKVDTTGGVVSVTTANGEGATQTAEFKDGAFKLAYGRDKGKGAKKVYTLITVSGPKLSCPPDLDHKAPHAAAAKSKKLWGSGKGRYRTRGGHSAATVRGTIWETKETCAGTLTYVRRGVVSVWDFTRHKRITVRKGHSYLARPADPPD